MVATHSLISFKTSWLIDIFLGPTYFEYRANVLIVVIKYFGRPSSPIVFGIFIF